MARENLSFESLIHAWCDSEEGFPSPAAKELAFRYMRSNPKGFALGWFATSYPEMVKEFLGSAPSAELLAGLVGTIFRRTQTDREHFLRQVAADAMLSLDDETLLTFALMVSSDREINFSFRDLKTLLDLTPKRALAGLLLMSQEELYEISPSSLTGISRWLEEEDPSLISELCSVNYPVAARLLASTALDGRVAAMLPLNFEPFTDHLWADIRVLIERGCFDDSKLAFLASKLNALVYRAYQATSATLQAVELMMGRHPELFSASTISFFEEAKTQGRIVVIDDLLNEGKPLDLKALLSEYSPSLYPRLLSRIANSSSLKPREAYELCSPAPYAYVGTSPMVAEAIKGRAAEWVEEFAKLALEDEESTLFSALMGELSPREALSVFSAGLDWLTDDNRFEYLVALRYFAETTEIDFSDEFNMDFAKRVFSTLDAQDWEHTHLLNEQTMMVVDLSKSHSYDHNFRTLALEKAAKMIGDDPKRWETFVVLMDNFSGSADELIKATIELS